MQHSIVFTINNYLSVQYTLAEVLCRRQKMQKRMASPCLKGAISLSEESSKLEFDTNEIPRLQIPNAHLAGPSLHTFVFVTGRPCSTSMLDSEICILMNRTYLILY